MYKMVFNYVKLKVIGRHFEEKLRCVTNYHTFRKVSEVTTL